VSTLAFLFRIPLGPSARGSDSTPPPRIVQLANVGPYTAAIFLTLLCALDQDIAWPNYATNKAPMTYEEAYRVSSHPAKFSCTITNAILYALVGIVSEWKVGNKGSARSWHAQTMLRTLPAQPPHLRVITVVAIRRLWALLTVDPDGVTSDWLGTRCCTTLSCLLSSWF